MLLDRKNFNQRYAAAQAMPDEGVAGYLEGRVRQGWSAIIRMHGDPNVDFWPDVQGRALVTDAVDPFMSEIGGVMVRGTAVWRQVQPISSQE
jgi:hypothetical protein